MSTQSNRDENLREEFPSEDSKAILCKFVFRCPRSWADLKLVKESESMIPGTDLYDEIRQCDDCDSPVYLCYSYEDVVRNVGENRCVALSFSGPQNGFVGMVVV